jgi:4-oxalocrotonate tautomerase
MPIVTVKLLPGRSAEQKEELARRITQDVQETLNVGPDAIWITFEEVPGADWYIAGKALKPARREE